MNSTIKYLLLSLIHGFALSVSGQDTLYARKIIDTLSSAKFNGRGYTNDGVNRAKAFLEKEFVVAGLTPMDGKKFIQPVSYPVNTFPGAMNVKLNGKQLRAGYDYIVSPESRELKGTFDLREGDSTHFINAKGKLIVSIEEKLTWSVAGQEADYTAIILLKEAVKEKPKTIEVDIENKLVKEFRTANVCGIVKGTQHPDSVILFTAHYDHLGGMGKEAYFPGANDNASGISLLLGLAKYYAKNPQPYSIGFICFTGEEAGLIGSEYFTNHPLIPLSSIRFLVNMDLTGTGVEGITVVNATEFEKEFNLLKSVNEKGKYLVAVNSRGKAKNSDHYWFTEKGVRAFFFYTLGGIKAYHDVHDVARTLPNNEYTDLFNLLRDFTSALVN